MDYTTLTADKSTAGSIKSWMNYAKVDSVSVLEEAQAMIYARLRVREMRTADTFPVGVGADGVDVPDGLLDVISLKDITNDADIEPLEQNELEDRRSWTAGVLDSGDPISAAIFDEMFNFDCKTTTAWTLRANFYVQPDMLSTSRKTNFLTRRYPHLLRMACLATGARFNDDDDKYAREQRLLLTEIEEINASDEMGRSTYVPVRS